MKRSIATTGLAAAGALMTGAYFLLTGRDPRSPRIARRSGRPRAAHRRDLRVRQAGREEMRDPPEQWDKVDESSDESFPASDPTSTY